MKKAGLAEQAKHMIGEDADESHHEIVEHPNFDDIAMALKTPTANGAPE